MTSTNMFTQARRVGVQSAATAGSVADLEDNASWQAWLGNAAGLGGFFFVMKFGFADTVSTANAFFGLSNGSNTTDVQPQTYTNIIGVGVTSGDTTLSIYGAGSSAQARISLGANFPSNTSNTDWYEAIFFAAPNASTVYYQVTRLNTGNVATGSLTGSNLPANTVFLLPDAHRSNGGTASAVAFDIGGMYLETEN